MTQFLRDQASDREEVVTPLMLDGTYLSRNYATLGLDLENKMLNARPKLKNQTSAKEEQRRNECGSG